MATDLLVWVLQLVMLAVSLERRRCSGDSDDTAAAGASTGPDEEAGSGQDHDAEERGEIRAANTGSQDHHDLPPARSSQFGSEASQERDELLASSMPTDTHPVDEFNSGECIIAQLDLFSMAQDQWSQRDIFRTNLSGPSGENPNNALVAAVLAGRNLDHRLRTGAPPLDN